MLSYKELEKLISYNPETGELFWKIRDADCFNGDIRAMKIWNTRYANTPALCAEHGTGYLSGSIMNEKAFAHRVAAALIFQTDEVQFVDHINGKRNDNRKVNIRIVATRSENMKNMKTPKDNTSGRIGVSFAKHCNRWHAYVTSQGKRTNIGWFENFDDACAARAEKERALNFHENHGR